MRSILGWALFLIVVGGLAYVTAYVAEGWADWVVLGGILVATAGVIIAYNHQRYPSPTSKRSYSRGPDSRW